MPVAHSCFISYTDGWTEEYEAIIAAIEKRLTESIQWHLNLKPWRYTTDQAVGAQFNKVIAARLCQSVSMVALYVPRYEVSEMCIREYVAMEDIERTRQQVLGIGPADDLPMVIPIILRKRRKGQLPDWIAKSRNYLDLTSYVTPDRPLIEALKHPDCVRKFDDIAETMSEIFRRLATHDPDPCKGCETELPNDQRVRARYIGQPFETLPLRTN
jgi:hypothetical protein